MALPIVLGIVVFLIASVLIMMSMVIYQSVLIEADYEYKEDYVNAVTEIKATVDILIENEDFSSQYLSDLETYMGVDISKYSDTTWMVSKTLLNGRLVRSYLSILVGDSLPLMDNLFAYDGLEVGFVYDPFITPSALLDSYLDQFFANTFPAITYTRGYGSIDDIFSYIDSLTDLGSSYVKVSPTVLTSQSNPTVSGHWFVNGNVNLSDNKNLTVPAGYLLFINGTLTMGRNSEIIGNVVVKDNVSIASKKTFGTISGTIYTGESFFNDKYLYLGTSALPSFVFSEKDVVLHKIVSGYGYFLSDKFSVDRRGTTINIIGGVYANQVSYLDSYEIQPYAGLDVNELYDYAVPSEIYAGGGGSGTIYIFTKPRD